MGNTFTIQDWQRQDILNQIGRWTLAAISGGRVTALPDGIELPVGAGYKVRVRLTPLDEYTVQRVLVRGGKEFDKGTRDAWAGNVSDLAYYASCYGNDGAHHGRWEYLG